ncbi:transcriptional regulator [Paramagnetospirillum kuznetsovii]|uniref:Transcriptional regulator n=1 Tax=Paramagnetospirillum kuznetsovii TaxID=2053833 RepID=A0A364NXT1_9PROT|nr:DegT/DnrJ/EryC1/StrS family aminotransferase [Paramagnetospirillum kuznetsovii]RAU21853.1 transcriptional regulator [Paramagnetospirillum kuznetsovii]
MSNSDVPVRFFGLDRQFARYRDEFMAITEQALSAGNALQGPAVADFEADIAALTGRRHAVAVGSATDALAFALMATGIGAGDEVLVTAFSFFASVSPILRVGASPRFIDIDPATYQMDVAALDRLVTPRTKALLAVHMFGQTLDMKAVDAFARRHDLIVIEDAAQALGAMDGDRAAGSMGLASCLSFDPTKVIGSFSSAGALVTDDDAVARTVRMLRYHGRDPDTRRYAMLGYNSQLSTEMAAQLRFKLAKLQDWQDARRRVANIYLDRLAGVGDVSLPTIRPGSSHNWHKFVLRCGDVSGLAGFLKQRGIETMIHYPLVLCDEPVIKQIGLPPEAADVPNARIATKSVVSLPIHSELLEAEAVHVADSVGRFFEFRSA